MRRERYPADWSAIALAVKDRAAWVCESCDQICLRPGEEWLTFILRNNWTLEQAIAAAEHPRRYILTAAHPHHDPENPAAELKAWCVSCHARHDIQAIRLKQHIDRERHGQLTAFQLAPPTPAGHGKNPKQIQLPITQEST